jgi:EAL domain-containing protein (putative c-di-GMP-specific phosphodiesterase class I)
VAIGVDYGQGNWIAPPRPLAEVTRRAGAAGGGPRPRR